VDAAAGDALADELRNKRHGLQEYVANEGIFAIFGLLRDLRAYCFITPMLLFC